jgi:hypothetical protein
MVATGASNHKGFKVNYFNINDICIFLSHYTIVRV